MPRPPMLPTIDWRELFGSGKDYCEWLKAGENPENRDRMEETRRSLAVDGGIESFLEGLRRGVHVVAIAEDWCGDVVRHVPVLQRLAETAGTVEVRYIMREERPDVFGRYLTNGGEAIPKFVFLSEEFVECGNWGPMPDACRELIARGKACGDVGAARKLVSQAYAEDPEQGVVVRELARLIDIAASASPDPRESALAVGR